MESNHAARSVDRDRCAAVGMPEDGPSDALSARQGRGKPPNHGPVAGRQAVAHGARRERPPPARPAAQPSATLPAGSPPPHPATQLSLCASTARAATPPSRQPWASPSSAPPSRRRELLWTAPRRVWVTRANSASSFRSLQDSGIIMNSLLQYCADSRVPRTDHIMYRFTQCSIMHLQVPYALIGVLTGVCVAVAGERWRWCSA